MKTSIVLFFCYAFPFFLNAQKKQGFEAYNQVLPGSSLAFKMVPVQRGTFLIGSAASEKNSAADEGPQQQVQLSAFWMGAYEVTRDEFDVFLKDEATSLNVDVDAITRPSPQYIDFSQGMGKEGGFPANSMSQYSALMYCRWLYMKTGVFYRLPTEAEWEYACRAGSTTAYYFGNDASQIDKYAWYKNNSGEKFQKVGQKLPNAWGLYDMLGNLMEWTLDHYSALRYNDLGQYNENPVAPVSTYKYPKALRGGSYAEPATDLRSARRFHSDPGWNSRDPQIPKSKWWLTEATWVGFRIVRPQVQPSAAAIEYFFKQYLGK